MYLLFVCVTLSVTDIRAVFASEKLEESLGEEEEAER